MFNLKSQISNLKSLSRGRLIALALSAVAVVVVAVIIIINQFEGTLGGERLRAAEEIVVKESKLRAPAAVADGER